MHAAASEGDEGRTLNYHRGHWKKWAGAVGDFVPEVRTAMRVYNEVEDLARPTMPYARGGHPVPPMTPWQFPGPPPNEWRVQDVRNRIGAMLAVPPDAPDAAQRLTAIDALLRMLPPVELDQVVVRLGTDGIWALDALLDGAFDHDQWDFCAVQRLLNFLLENVSPYAVGLLGRYLPWCQPSIDSYWESGKDEGWIIPAGPFVVFDDASYLADEGFRVEASVAPMAWQDMRQGQIGDCWFLTSAQAVCKANPGFMPQHIRQNPNGTVTVTFYHRSDDDRSPCPITVTPDLPVRNGRLFGACGHVDDPAYAELWPAYYEKAFAQSRGAYEDIDGGRGYDALPTITGRPNVSLDVSSPNLFSEIDYRLRNGWAIVVSTIGRSDSDKMLNGRLICKHEYFVKGVDPQSGRICLGNPWGDESTKTEWECWLTYAEAAAHLDDGDAVFPW